MDEVGKHYHALIAVLNSIREAGGDLDKISSSVQHYTGSNSSPLEPLHCEEVIETVNGAIWIVKMSAIPDPGQEIGPSDGTINMQCPDCLGRRKLPSGEKCEMCQGTGAVVKYR